MSTIAYPIGNSLYLNITNRCMNHCDFCVRYKTIIFNGKYPLWLEKEPSVKEILAAIGDPKKHEEIIFCGYGEPLIRLKEVIGVAKALKSSGVPVRVNTNGQANLFHKKNILPKLKGLINSISISLNAPNATAYDSLCHSIFGRQAYEAVIDFIKESKKYIPHVEATIVDLPQVDKETCAKIAQNLEVGFRVRPYYEAEYRK